MRNFRLSLGLLAVFGFANTLSAATPASEGAAWAARLDARARFLQDQAAAYNAPGLKPMQRVLAAQLLARSMEDRQAAAALRSVTSR